MANTASLKQDLFDNGVYDAWQFVQNTAKIIHTASFCRETIEKLIARMEDEHEAWMNSLFEQLKVHEGVIHKVSITSDDLPKHETIIADDNVDSSFLLDKLTKDYFQYSRNAFDCMAQIANAGCLAFKAKTIERVDFGTMFSVFNQQTYSQDFPLMKAWFDTIDSSDEYKYIDAFCNRTKHTCDVYLKVSMAFLGGENKSVINPFFHKKTPHEKHDIRSYLSQIEDFVRASWESFLNVLKGEITKQTYVVNRHHKLKVYQQKMKDDTMNSFSMVYIEGTGTIDSMPDEIQVMLLSQAQDGDIYAKNCEVDTIYIEDQNCERKYIGKYEAIEPYGDDTLLRNRRYRKVAHDAASLPLEFQAMMDEKQKVVFYHANAFMDILSISDDNDFLKRVQLPF